MSQTSQWQEMRGYLLIVQLVSFQRLLKLGGGIHNEAGSDRKRFMVKYFNISLMIIKTQ